MLETQQVDPFLETDFLERLEHLMLLTKKKAKGANLGEHQSIRSGGSQEFLDYRTYQPGDDLRYVDWNVYGRLGRLFIKLFKAEKEQSVYILLDMSASMAAGNPLKAIYSKKIAAALSYICLANMDRVMVSSFNDRMHFSKTPERGRQVYFLILEFLRSLKAEGITDLNAALTEFASSARKNGVVIILSDLLSESGFEQGMKALEYQNLDINLIQILDQKELMPTLNGYLKLKDWESGTQDVMTVDKHLRDLYRQKMESFLLRIKEHCHAIGADYFLTETSTPFDTFLIEYLIEGNLIK
ncbi:MAG: DUF58 domain-containing protein [SAR324 cluster bacterium]|nr:DUF58 domain-containing protein [SAR324 cluster bacterium]